MACSWDFVLDKHQNVCDNVTMMNIVILHTRVGVNMGDHAQDVITAIDVDTSMSLDDIVDLLDLDGADYITVRVASPLDDETDHPF